MSSGSFAEGIRIIEADGDVDQSFVDVANDSIDCLPEDLLSEFVSSGWRIYVTGMDIDSVLFGGKWGSVMGCTDYDTMTIYIEDRDVAVKEAPVHEIGHWFDYMHGRISQTSEFSTIYEEETSAFYEAFDYYSHYEQEELWAECFWKYFTDQETLSAYCPKTFSYINRYVSPYLD